ncbi:hypothetical protein RHSIM_RhsimUnG0235700 [Rhododendron simsii]|uniref:Cystatin domain-containing protein n=1 Tax=Rhododendron simsii TaxID=118357 RepID=A0A834FUC0_RHOSS|nr:hypothetical protein RHSIM_RhsimUnG0235700 [Rhododendron simsii]
MDTGCDSLVGDEFAVETARSPSSAKKQRREDTPEPPSLVEEETDPRSEIQVYKYDSDVEDDSDGMHEMTEKEYEEYHRQLEESEGMNLEFVKVVKANAVPVAGLRYYITFDVKDGDVVDGNTTREFQAHVWDGIGHTEVLFCRPKSTT